MNSSHHSIIKDIDPSTGKLYAWVEQAGMEEIEQAIATAHRASKTWGSSLASEREAVLAQAANVLIARTDEIRDVLVKESGSTAGKAMYEIAYGIDLLRIAAGSVRQVLGETMPMTMPGQISMTFRRPLGVVAGISPFNAPFLLAIKKVVPALASGNSFVLKPSEETPVVGLKIAEIFQQAGLPAGVLNVIPGPAQPNRREVSYRPAG